MYRNLVISLVVMLFCAGFWKGIDLTGNWKGKNITFEISKEGDMYRVIAHNPSGMAGGRFIGKYQDGIIKIGSPLCGDITYSKETDKLFYCGEELGRGP